MTPEAISNTQDGRELMRMETKSNPAVTLFNEIFFSVLTAEWKSFQLILSCQGKLKTGHWQAERLFFDKTVKQVVSRVELKGEALVNEIILYESSGW